MKKFKNIYNTYFIKPLVFLKFVLSVNAYANTPDLWNKQITNTTKNISRVYFTDSINGWAAGDFGLIIHTSTGGNIWEVQNSFTNFSLSDIRFINSITGWAIANNYSSWPNCTILKTTNSGINWTKYPFADTTLLLFTICFQNEFTGWAAGYQGIILKTNDGGLSWTLQPRDSSGFGYNSIYRIKFFNNYAIACGGFQDFAGVVWKNTNLGSNWPSKGIGSEPLFDIVFLDSNIIFCVGGDPEYGLTLFKTTDSGVNWQFDTLNVFGIGKGISFRTQTEGWIAASFASEFVVTTDAGASWREIPAPDKSILNEVSFKDERNGWAAG